MFCQTFSDSSPRVPQTEQGILQEVVREAVPITVESSETSHQIINGSINDSECDGISVSLHPQAIDSLQFPKHSTPMPSSKRNWNDLENSFLEASPVEGRRSGRVRKATLKGENLHGIFKQNREKADSLERLAVLSNKSISEKEFSGQLKQTTGKRGRPRKVVAVPRDGELTEDCDRPSEEGGRVAKLSDKCTAEKESSGQLKQTTGKRGRPKKVVAVPRDGELTEDCDRLSEDAEWLAEQSDKSTAEKDSSGQLEQTKGRRGRPRKVVAVPRDGELTEDNDRPSEEAETVLPKRKRGRPKRGSSGPASDNHTAVRAKWW